MNLEAMSDNVINRWIQAKLGIAMNWTPTVFCQNTQDGYLLSQMLRSYEIISEDQLNQVKRSEIRQTCVDNFEKYISHWLTNVGIFIEDEDINNIVESNGYSSICLFYKVFLELIDKDNITFITHQRLNEKLRPTTGKFTITEVKSSPTNRLPELKNKYSAPLEDCYDIIHWHQDRLETLINKCKSAREEYRSMIRIREKRLSSNYSTDTNIFAVENRFVPQPMTQVVESQDSVDLSYNELVEERKNFLKKENFQPNLMASKKILNKFKAEVQNHAKNSIFKRELQKTVLNSFWNRIENEDGMDSNKESTEKLLKRSFYEKQMLRKLGEVKYQREAMIQNKQVITEKIGKEKETEFIEHVVQRYKNIEGEAFQYYLEKEKLNELHRRIYDEKLGLKAEKRKNMCRVIMSDICDLAIKESEYKELFEEEPSKVVRDNWKKMFIAAVKLNDFVSPLENIVKQVNDLTEEEETIIHYEIDRQDQLDELDFESYKLFEWPWELENIETGDTFLKDMTNGENILGYIVYLLLNTKYPPPALPPAPDFSKAKVAACVNGIVDFSWLHILQKLLKHKKIEVIVMQDAINFCLNAYREEMKTAKEDEQTNKDDTKKRSKPKKEPKSRKGAKSKPERSQNEIEPDQDTPDMLDKSVQTPRRYPCERINLTAKAELGKIADETLSEGMPVTDYLLVSMFIELLKSTPNMGDCGRLPKKHVKK